MFDYLQQFNKLPKELKEKVSSPRAMEILASLEKKYNVNLAMLTMQIMVKQILFKDLPAYFSSEMGLDLASAKSLSEELREKLFFSLSTYLGLRPQVILSPEEKELAVLMKDNNIILPSQDLLSRCRNILLTYRKGVRSKIDTRAALERKVDHGGIGLDSQMAEKLLNLVNGRDSNPATKEPLTNNETTRTVDTLAGSTGDSIQNEIDKLINREESAASYDFKKTLAAGNLQVPVTLATKFKPQLKTLDPSHELKAPVKNLALKNPDEAAPMKVAAETPTTKNINQKIINQEVKLDNTDFDQEEVIAPSLVLPVEKLEQLANLVPEERANNGSFKKPNKNLGGHKDSFLNKFFKAKEKKVNNAISPLAGMKSSHLEAMVKAASLQAQIGPRPAAASESRPKMHDVKVKPKMMGPLEELRYLDLINFRRLGETPEQVTEKIINKIKILKKDGYDKMILGVQAWRQSPVNQSYIRLMQEAVVKGLTLDKLLGLRAEQDKSGLSKAEIDAIVDMNSKLLF